MINTYSKNPGGGPRVPKATTHTRTLNTASEQLATLRRTCRSGSGRRLHRPRRPLRGGRRPRRPLRCPLNQPLCFGLRAARGRRSLSRGARRPLACAPKGAIIASPPLCTFYDGPGTSHCVRRPFTIAGAPKKLNEREPRPLPPGLFDRDELLPQEPLRRGFGLPASSALLLPLVYPPSRGVTVPLAWPLVAALGVA